VSDTTATEIVLEAGLILSEMIERLEYENTSLREQLISSEYRLGLADRNLEVVRGTVVEIKEQLRLAQEQLKEYRSWIIHTSEAEDVCTFYVLKEICINCRCSRAAPPTKVEGSK
jgi:hypothetical protein